MKLCCFFVPALILSSVVSSESSPKDIAQEETYKTIYVYFGGIRAIPEYLKVSGNFYTSNGKSHEIAGTLINGTSMTKDMLLEGAFWRFSIPTDTYSSVFNLTDLNGQLYISSGASKIGSCVYLFNIKNYDSMEPSSGWGALSLKSNVFVDYFVMDIDPNLSSEDGGYLLYPSLKRDLFDHLIDYSETAAEKLTWTDKYLGETSFLKKWNLIKNRYESEKPDERIAYWYYVLGALILVTAILCFFPLFLKDKWKARKK